MFSGLIFDWIVIFLDNSFSIGEFICIHHPPAAAADVNGVAVNQILHRVSRGHRQVMLDGYQGLEGRGGGEGPTGAAVLLVLGHGDLALSVPVY